MLILLLSKSLVQNTQTDTIRYEFGPCLYIAYVTGFIQVVLGVVSLCSHTPSSDYQGNVWSAIGLIMGRHVRLWHLVWGSRRLECNTATRLDHIINIIDVEVLQSTMCEHQTEVFNFMLIPPIMELSPIYCNINRTG